jgi:hypothetical protein
MAFFELRTPRDMLDKAERELARFQREFTMDNLFNFFVTAYHIQDYVKGSAAVPQSALDSFLADADLKACHDLCDKGKHLRLTKRPDPTTDIADGCFSGAAFSELAFDEGEEWKLLYDDRAVEVRWLADSVIRKWKHFFEKHGL